MLGGAADGSLSQLYYAQLPLLTWITVVIPELTLLDVPKRIVESRMATAAVQGMSLVPSAVSLSCDWLGHLAWPPVAP